jgi:adenylate cyclase
VGRAVVGLTGDRPGVIRELGLGGLQVWQSVLERFGRGAGEHEVVLVFTDLVEFSRWGLRAGDDEVLRVLREVGDAWEPPMTERAGTVVERLGDAGKADEILVSGDLLDGRGVRGGVRAAAAPLVLQG